MAKQIISLKIDVNKITKEKLYKGIKGNYLNCNLILNDEIDQYGNSGFIVESTSADERNSGIKGVILGNAKIVSKVEAKNEPILEIKKEVENKFTEFFDNDLPF